MTTKTWARSADGKPFAAGSIIAELQTFDPALVPGKDIPAIWSQDVTAVADVAAGWVLGSGGFAPPAALAPTQADLVSYANAKQEAVCDGGITVNVGSASTPDGVNVASDTKGRTLVTGCVQLIGVAQQAGQPAPTFQWINDDGTQLTLTSAQMMTIALKLGSFVQATYATLGAVLAAISSGAIATHAEIDTPPAPVAWPATSY